MLQASYGKTRHYQNFPYVVFFQRRIKYTCLLFIPKPEAVLLKIYLMEWKLLFFSQNILHVKMFVINNYSLCRQHLSDFANGYCMQFKIIL